MMIQLTRDYIRHHIADSAVIYQRGIQIFEHGALMLQEALPDKGQFTYRIDGNYGDYTTRIQVTEKEVITQCDCPYPGIGCKHTVAALLDAGNVIDRWRVPQETEAKASSKDRFLSPEEIKRLALQDREKRARSEKFSVTEADTIKGEHLV